MKRLVFLIAFAMPWLGLWGLSERPALAEDIDIYTQPPVEDAGLPNVLIILDNTANWNDNAQHWPDTTQGEAEIRALAKVLYSLPNDSYNVGLLMNSNAVGGAGAGAYIRFAMRTLDATTKAAWLDMLGMEVVSGEVVPKSECVVTANAVNGTPNCMYQHAQQSISSSGEQGASSAEYSRAMFEAFKYYGGYSAPDGTTEPTDSTHFGPYRFGGIPDVLPTDSGNISRVDAAAFSDWDAASMSGDVYTPPATSGCGGNYIIFIGNGLPSADSDAISDDMVTNVHFDTDKLPWQDYTLSSVTRTDACFDKTDCTTGECSSADYPAECSDGTYTSCACGVTDSTGCTSTTETDTCFAMSACSSDGCSSDHFPPECGDGTYTSCACGFGGSTCNLSEACFYTTDCIGNCGADDFPAACDDGTYASCACGTSVHDDCGNNKDKYCIIGVSSAAGTTSCINGERTIQSVKHCIDGNYTYSTMVASGEPHTPTGNVTSLYADEWARYLRGTDVDGTDDPNRQQPVVTFTLNVFNAKPDADQTALLQNMAHYGGGDYCEATNEDAIAACLTQDFINILSVNSVFAASSLPINATNRTQNENQVYIGMFRPDSQAKPRWFGNTKRYKLGLIPGTTKIDLVDDSGNPAINTAKQGFIQPCAVSKWTTDTSFTDGEGNVTGYWSQTGTYPNPKGDANCVDDASHSPWSDSPDGPFVEKGAAAEVLRRGNDPTGADASSAPPWHVNRSVKTLNLLGTALDDFSLLTAPTVVLQTVIDFTKGYDVSAPQEYPYNAFDETCTPLTGSTCGSRPSIHGDVVHSRPLAVNYGGSDSVVLYYGANDGSFRSVRSSDGKELWAFIAPENFSKLSRLYLQSPNIGYPGIDDLTATPKDYFWDGSSGIWQTWTQSDAADPATAYPDKTYIYPTARRGGRFIYAFDVTDPVVDDAAGTGPSFLWRHPNPLSLTDVTTFSGLGQTWSRPNVAYVETTGGNATSEPRVIFGGGYDTCEDVNYPDTDGTNFNCGNPPLGAGVYVLNAESGALKYYSATGGRSVAGDVTLVDIDGDNLVDFGYFADTAGNLYRLTMADSNLLGKANDDDSTADAFSVTRIAYTSGAGRKFLYAPAALVNQGKVILAFGSGDREHPLATDYPYTTPVSNRFYVFIDTPTEAVTTPYNLDDTNTMTDLSAYNPANGCGTPITDNYPTFRGWFINLCGDTDTCRSTGADSTTVGEQTVTSALIVGGIIFFSTNRPTPDAGDLCTGSLGEARGYALNLVNASGVIGESDLCGGDRSNAFLNGGLPPSPVVARVPVGEHGQIVTAVLGGIQLDGSVSSVIGGQNVEPHISSVRSVIYWHTGSD